MDKKKLEEFRKKLETRQQELRKSVVQTEEDGRAADSADVAQDIADRASSSYQKEFLFHRSNNDRQMLQMVDGALARVREGSYGECISCGNDIEARRLEAVPWTRYCLVCQEKLEQGTLEPATEE
jgi:DnaK suppressor protein